MIFTVITGRVVAAVLAKQRKIAGAVRCLNIDMKKIIYRGEPAGRTVGMPERQSAKNLPAGISHAPVHQHNWMLFLRKRVMAG